MRRVIIGLLFGSGLLLLWLVVRTTPRPSAPEIPPKFEPHPSPGSSRPEQAITRASEPGGSTDSAASPQPSLNYAELLKRTRVSFDSQEARADPEYLPILRRQVLRSIEIRYGTALRQLGFPSDTVEKLRALLADRNTALLEFRALARDIGSSEQVMADASARAVRDIDKQIEDLIGADKVAQLEAMRRRSTVELTMADREAGADLSAAGVPLTSEQAASLSALYKTRKPLSGPTDTSTGLPPDLYKMYNAAASFLTAEQLAVFLDTLRFKATHEAYVMTHSKPAHP